MKKASNSKRKVKKMNRVQILRKENKRLNIRVRQLEMDIEFIRFVSLPHT